VIKSNDKKIFMIVDNLRVHHAKLVKAWEEKHKDKIKLFYLPPYSPEFNPDEYLNISISKKLKIAQIKPKKSIQKCHY